MPLTLPRQRRARHGSLRPPRRLRRSRRSSPQRAESDREL